MVRCSTTIASGRAWRRQGWAPLSLSANRWSSQRALQATVLLPSIFAGIVHLCSTLITLFQRIWSGSVEIRYRLLISHALMACEIMQRIRWDPLKPTVRGRKCTVADSSGSALAPIACCSSHMPCIRCMRFDRCLHGGSCCHACKVERHGQGQGECALHHWPWPKPVARPRGAPMPHGCARPPRWPPVAPQAPWSTRSWFVTQFRQVRHTVGRWGRLTTRCAAGECRR